MTGRDENIRAIQADFLGLPRSGFISIGLQQPAAGHACRG